MIEILNNPKYKKVYLSGPITGIEDDNKYTFENYKEKFKVLGFKVISPLDLFEPWEIRQLKQRVIDKIITEKEMWVICMKRDLPEMYKQDFVAVLPGWALSEGANLEVYSARKLLMPIIDAETLKELF